jgi:signal transduction histidine kinase
MTSRTWLILVFAFGTLVILIGLVGAGASQRARKIQDEMTATYGAERQITKTFYDIHSGIHRSEIFVRDYLLDPSYLRAPLHRRGLLEARASMAKRLGELGRLLGRDEDAAFRQLQYEIDAYWNSLEPVFEWTPKQKIAVSTLFLRQQVLPRRDTVLELARGIQALNDNNFHRQQQKLKQSQADFRTYVKRMVAVTLSLGLLVACASILRISRLERKTEEQQKRTERAEGELRRLSQQLVQALEAERKSISRELHDEVGQKLTALRMELGNLEDSRTLPAVELSGRLEEAKQLAEQTLAVVRNLAMGLRPAMLDDLGLGPALEWQGREFSRRSGIPVSVQIDGSLDGLSDSHRTCIFRVVQEALTNCARHARAKNVRVAVHARSDMVFLTVQDDGVGIAGFERSGRGLGLIGIEERARELGGTATIHSQPHKGTSLKVEIPLKGEVAL